MEDSVARIVVVEDDDSVRNAIVGYLSRHAFAAITHDLRMLLPRPILRQFSLFLSRLLSCADRCSRPHYFCDSVGADHQE